MKDTYEKSRQAAAKVIELLEEDLGGEDYFVCGLTALEMAKANFVLSLSPLYEDDF